MVVQQTVYVTLYTRTAQIEKVQWNIPRFVRLWEVSQNNVEMLLYCA